MFCFVVVVVVAVVDSKNGMDPPWHGGILLCGRGGRVGGAQQRSKKRPDGAWPDQADRAERGGGGRVAETEREIKTERLIDRQTEKEGDREICSSS